MDVAIKRLLDKNSTFLKDQTKLNPDIIETLQNYTGGGFEPLNKRLRETKGVMPEDENKRDIMRIDTLFSFVDPLTEPITLYRGVGREAYTTKEDYGFISTSYDIEEALVFTNIYEGKRVGERRTCCLIVINVPVGTRCIFLEEISYNPTEKEVLLPRNGKFVLTSVGLSQDPTVPDRYFVTFMPNTAVELETMSDAVVKGAEKLKILEKVVEKVEKEFPPLEAHYQINHIIHSKLS